MLQLSGVAPDITGEQEAGMLIYQTLERARRLYPSSEAFVDGERRMTYAELGDRVDCLAGTLAAAGLEPGARAGILMQNRVEYTEAYFGVEKAGGVLAPLNQRLAPPEIAFILNDAEATHLLLDAAYLPLYARFRDDVPTLRSVLVVGDAGDLDRTTVQAYEDALAAATPMREPARAWQPDDMVQLYYTSGTTGKPKGVILTQENVMANARHAIMAMHFDDRDVWVHGTPMFHLADAWASWTITWVGGRHIYLRDFSPVSYLTALQEHRVTVSLLVPTMINAIVNEPRVREFDVSSLRLLAFGASPMPVDRLKAAMAVFPNVTFIQLYGMTETAPFATALRYDERIVGGPEQISRRLASCGREIPGVEARVIRPDGSEVTPGEVGEIVMRGPNIMKGYWRQPEVSAETLRGGWMHSGDMATVDEEGYIFIVDRLKDMIITGGENVYSTEVENVMYQHPAVLEAAVIGIPDPHWGERVHAVVVLKEGQSVEPDALADFCRRFIAGYKIPRSFEFVDALPKTGSGKIQKAEIRAAHWREHEATTGRRV
jgi:long-chain acyl-CoA synthetase